MISLTFLFTTVVLIVLVLHSEAFGVSRITTTQKSTILHGIFGGLSKVRALQLLSFYGNQAYSSLLHIFRLLRMMKI